MYLLKFLFNKRTGIAAGERFQRGLHMPQRYLRIPATASTRTITTKATDTTRLEPMAIWKNETWDCLRLNMVSLLLL